MTLVCPQPVTVVPAVNPDATEAHLRRVACWCAELADAYGLDLHQKQLLERAAMKHHTPALLWNSRRAQRIFNDLHLPAPESATDPELDAVLAAFHGVPETLCPPPVIQLASILEAANALDESFEADGWFMEERSMNPVTRDAMGRLRTITEHDLELCIRNMPILPTAAVAAFQIALNEEARLQDLVSVCRLDPVLAGFLIKAANSCLNSPVTPIRDLERAVTHVGLDMARYILVGAALRPLFASEKLQLLWNHSIEAGLAAEHLATSCGYENRGEAFLAGLVHDIGQLLLVKLPGPFQTRYGGLRKRGCPATQVEQVLCGFTHADAGAEILQSWNFHPSIVEAVAHHHRLPAKPSLLASILHLTEFRTCLDEDLPSLVRLEAAVQRCDVNIHDLITAEELRRKPVDLLRFAA